MDGAIPTTPSKNTPKLPTTPPSSPKKLLTYLPTYLPTSLSNSLSAHVKSLQVLPKVLPTYFPTYLLPLSLSKFLSALKTYQRLTYLPIQNYLSNSLHYLQVLPTYPPSHSLSLKLQYIPTYWVLPSYLLTYLPTSSKVDQSVAY